MEKGAEDLPQWFVANLAVPAHRGLTITISVAHCCLTLSYCSIILYVLPIARFLL